MAKKGRKAAARLAGRIIRWEATQKLPGVTPGNYIKPGSLKK